jgi:hypothetical protein
MASGQDDNLMPDCDLVADRDWRAQVEEASNIDPASLADRELAI